MMELETEFLTDWERKERDGLLAVETEEWRQKRLVAENLNTSSNVLARLTKKIVPAWLNDFQILKSQGHLLVAAIAIHPNTSPDTLLGLFNLERSYHEIRQARNVAQGFFHVRYNTESELIASKMFSGALSLCVRGICRNPVSPFLCLERGDFWAQVWAGQGYLLRDRTLPHAIASQLAQQKQPFEDALNHIALSGEISADCEKQSNLSQLSRAVRTARGYSSDDFKLTKSEAENLIGLDLDAQSFLWIERLKAAILLPLTKQPLPLDVWKRSPLDLLNHLAHDGNRFVRWVAQTRLADPDLVFTWTDEK